MTLKRLWPNIHFKYINANLRDSKERLTKYTFASRTNINRNHSALSCNKMRGNILNNIPVKLNKTRW